MRRLLKGHPNRLWKKFIYHRSDPRARESLFLASNQLQEMKSLLLWKAKKSRIFVPSKNTPFADAGACSSKMD